MDSPFRKGRIEDVVTPARPRVKKVRKKSTTETANCLYIDLVQVFANSGITLSNVHSLAMDLAKRGWVKQQQIENPKERN